MACSRFVTHVSRVVEYHSLVCFPYTVFIAYLRRLLVPSTQGLLHKKQGCFLGVEHTGCVALNFIGATPTGLITAFFPTHNNKFLRYTGE